MATLGRHPDGFSPEHEPVVVAPSAYHEDLMPARDGNARSAEWLRPRVEQQGLQRYVSTLRERWKLIVAITLLTTAVSIAYVLSAEKEYTAVADMLVTPVSQTDPA